MALNRKSSILCQLYERFLRDLTDVTLGDDVDEEEYVKFKAKIMKLVDDNNNGKLEAKELSKIIPTEENFLLCYSIQSQNMGTFLSMSDFMEIWCHYDTDRSGYLDYTEAKQFMKDMLKVNNCSMDVNNVEYLDTFFKTFDIDDNGVIEIDEMASIFPVEEKFANALKIRKTFTKQEYDRIFSEYDKQNTGFVAPKLLPKLLHDLSKTHKNCLNDKQISELSGRLIQLYNNKDIPCDELSLIISSQTPEKCVDFKKEMKRKSESG